jgi:hypothetical protein
MKRIAATALLLISCGASFPIDWSASARACETPLTFREAYEIALASARVESLSARLYHFDSDGQRADGRARDWRFAFTWPSDEAPRVVVLVACGKIEPEVGTLHDRPRDLARADAIERWGLASDSPQWFRDTEWPAGGALMSNANDCSGPADEENDTPRRFFCAPDAERGALVLAYLSAWRYDPERAAWGSGYLPRGLELWPTHRIVAVRETPDPPVLVAH